MCVRACLVSVCVLVSCVLCVVLRMEPPGPTPLPLIGNLLQLDLRRICDSYMELSKKYGSVFTLHMGTKKVVFLTGYKTVKEALGVFDEQFGDRDPLAIAWELSNGHGVTWSNGDSWKEMRRFAMTSLRDFGMGRKVCEEKIIEESQHLVDVFRKFKGKAFDTTQSMNYAVSNIICSIVYGSRFEYDDPEFTSLVDESQARIHLASSLSLQIYNMLPSLFSWVPNRKKFFILAAANKSQNTIFFNRLKQTFDPQRCRGLVDAFLLRKQQLKDLNVSNSHFHDENLMMTVINLFGGATDTTSATLRWGLLYMAKYPKIQDKVQEELRTVIGDRQVQMSDKKNLNFTNAVIYETQRLASVVPMSLPHRTSQDVTFQGHFIRKGTTVYPFIRSVHLDESQWARPESFHPLHFLDEDGKFTKRDAFMAFSAGRRICLGESLAQMELFLFFSTLLQRFRFTPPPGVTEEELDLTPRYGMLTTPSLHTLCAVPCESE
uniref:Cytochrome P450 2K1-like n=1 Tax=Gouania willdenowi TaxID=441366 RepID=A0A8C5E7U8_GOUWI